MTPGCADKLFVFKLDRLTRSGVADTFQMVQELRRAGCGRILGKLDDVPVIVDDEDGRERGCRGHDCASDGPSLKLLEIVRLSTRTRDQLAEQRVALTAVAKFCSNVLQLSAGQGGQVRGCVLDEHSDVFVVTHHPPGEGQVNTPDRRWLLIYGSIPFPFVGPGALVVVSSAVYYRWRREQPERARWLSKHAWLAVGLNVCINVAILLLTHRR